MLKKFGISKEIENLALDVEKEIKPQFEKIEKICEENSFQQDME